MTHELVIAEALLRVALEEARQHGASRVRALRLEIGDLEGLEPGVLQESFDVVAQGTRAAGARLTVDAVPAKIVCEDCGRESSGEKQAHGGDVSGRCPECGGRWRIVRGRGWKLLSVKVET
jgi:hydrogenase nickel incorporation protein HypA/HybF